MLDFYQKRKLRSIVNARLTQVCLALVVGFVWWQAYERYAVAEKVSERRATYEATAAALVTQRDELADEVRYLQDERGIQAELRRQFDIALPGEAVVVILEEAPTDRSTTTATAAVSDESTSSWWQW